MLFATKNSSYNLSSPFILYLCHTLKINKPKYYKTMAKELELKYGCNPNQKPSRIFMQEGELPIEVLNGRPGYINFLDAFNQTDVKGKADKAMAEAIIHMMILDSEPAVTVKSCAKT